MLILMTSATVYSVAKLMLPSGAPVLSICTFIYIRKTNGTYGWTPPDWCM